MRTRNSNKAAMLVMAAFLSVVPICAADEYEQVLRQALAMEEKGDRKAEIEALKKAVSLDPEEPVGHFLLGRAYFLMQKNDDAAEELNLYMEKMKPARGLDEEKLRAHIANLYSASEIYFTLGKYPEAKNAIAEIISLDPDDQGAYYNMGVCYYAYEHDRSKAYQNFKKAVDLAPDTELARKASYAIDFIRNNPDSRLAPDFSFLDKE